VRLEFGPILDDSDPPLPEGIVTESGRRTRSADHLRETLSPYLADYGITRVANLTGFDFVGLPVHMAVKPQGRTLSSGSGKGSTINASWVSAVMEASEQSVWESAKFEKIQASRSNLQRMGLSVADGNDLPQQTSAIWHEELPIDWTLGWDIVSGSSVWVPESLASVSLRRTGNLDPFVSGSNGLASGAHVLEALLSGLQEVIERDGLVLRTMVNPAPHMTGDELLGRAAPTVWEKIQRSGLLLEVADVTTEIGVPIVAAYLHELEGGTTGSFKGMGAGVNIETALVRAVTEAAQARCLIVAGARDDMFETDRAASVQPAPRRATPQQSLTAGVDYSTGSVATDIDWMVSQLGKAGFHQVIVLRLSSPGDPVQVVRVIVPGLEGYPFQYTQLGKRARHWKHSPPAERKSA